ncbi:glutamate receptor U1-like [Haliotis cracherodii]|uniref:glutamate receptor U1-like n=1 Tax=Haliotis cracherodii TaxID=6455 RepID=UPI0039EBA2CA
MLNFSYIITEPKDGDWGLPINDSYDGVVGQLYRREIDIAACDLTIDKGRSQYMEYIYPPIYTESLVVLYMKHDSSSNDSIFLLAGPFQPIVYIVVLLWTCVLPLLLTVVESLALDNRTSIQMEASNVSYTRMIKSNIFTYSWDFLGSLLKQGFCKQPSSTPGKVLVSSWWMMVLVLTSVYSANLIAAFSLRNDIHPFSNLEELLHSDYAIGMIPTGLSYYIIKTSRRSSLLGRLWDRITNTDLALLQANASVHLQRLKRDQYAYLDYRSYADRIMAKDCRLDVLDERITWEHLAFGVQQRSPLKADIERV